MRVCGVISTRPDAAVRSFTGGFGNTSTDATATGLGAVWRRTIGALRRGLALAVRTAGFTTLTVTLLPVRVNPTTETGRDALGLRTPLPPTVSLPQLPQDDASCLQLGTAQTPSLLGVPTRDWAPRGAFRVLQGEGFDALPPEDGTVPVWGDLATVLWGLHLGVGDTLDYTTEGGEPVRLRIMGILEPTLFQGQLLMDEAHLKAHWPGRAQLRVFLTEGPAPELARALTDYGVSQEPAADRLEAFAAVEASYLIIFRALGGLGVALGALGLGLLTAKNVMLRRTEHATLHALGFSWTQIRGGLAREHLSLLGVGAVGGGAAAALALHPRWALGLPLGEALTPLALMVGVGTLSIAWALRRVGRP